MGNHCQLCKSMSISNKVVNPKTGRESFTAGGTCSTSNIVYAAECLQHQLLYVGHTSRQLNHRMNSHRSEINNGVKTCELVKHFCDNNCSFNDHLRVHILQDNLPDNLSAREFHEDKWMTRLQTTVPHGMNRMTQDFAQTFYSLF